MSRTQETLLECDRMEAYIASVHSSKLADTYRMDSVRHTRALYCVVLGRYDEALSVYASFENIDLRQKLYPWIFQAMRGQVDEAFEIFNKGPESLSILHGHNLAPGGWDEYSRWALEYGLTDVARAVYERML